MGSQRAFALLLVLVMVDALSHLNAALSYLNTARSVHRRAPAIVLAAKKKAASKKKATGGAKATGFGAVATPKPAKQLSPEQRQWLAFMDWVASSGGEPSAAVKLLTAHSILSKIPSLSLSESSKSRRPSPSVSSPPSKTSGIPVYRQADRSSETEIHPQMQTK